MLALLYDSTIYSLDPLQITGRWSVPGGLQRFDVHIRANNRSNVEYRKRAHLGKRFIVVDKLSDKPFLDGVTVEIVPDGNHLILRAESVWTNQCYRELDTTGYASTDTVTSTIKTVLTDHVSEINSDQSNIDTNSTTLDGWAVDDPQGSYPGDIIKELAGMSDSSNNKWDFWFQQGSMNGVLPRNPYPYFKTRSASPSADWLLKRDMLVDEEQAASNIYNIATIVRVYYGTVIGSHDGANNASNLSDSTATLLTDGVMDDDTVYNVTDDSRAKLSSVTETGATTPLYGGTDGDWDTNDEYRIEMQNLQVASASTTATYWDREIAIDAPKLTATQAGQLAQQLLDMISVPVYQQPIVIGSRWLYNGGHAKRKIWRPFLGGGYFKALDFDLSPRVGEDTFFATAMDWDWQANTLRVVLELPDDRLDTLLENYGITGGVAV